MFSRASQYQKEKGQSATKTIEEQSPEQILLEQLRQLLNIPPEERSDQNISDIAKQVGGDIGDAFYIILSGGVTIYIDEPTEYKNFMQLKEKNRLGKGAAFGEIALITNSKRTATIMANQPTELIILEKDVFQAFIKEKKSLHLQKIQAFLENMNLFTLLPENILLEITTKCQIKKYPSNTIIMRQGDDAAAIYFVRKGQVKAVKSIPFKYDPFTKNKVPFDISDPPADFQISENYENDRDYYYKCDFLEVDEFNDGDVFGEQSVFYSEVQEFSAISSSPCEVIYITVFDLNKIIPKDNFQMYKESLKKYPCDADIRQIYWERKHWHEFKKRMISDINIEKGNKKGFMKNLRMSIPRYSTKEIPFNMSDIQINDNRLYFNIMEQMCNIDEKNFETRNFQDLTQSYQQAAKQLINDLNQQSVFIQISKIGRKISTRPSISSKRQSIVSNGSNKRSSVMSQLGQVVNPSYNRNSINLQGNKSPQNQLLPPINQNKSSMCRSSFSKKSILTIKIQDQQEIK